MFADLSNDLTAWFLDSSPSRLTCTLPFSFRMLDFFAIFSKGGILLWCFKGAGILPKEWEAFTPAVNTFIKTVLLQVRN